MSHDWPILGGAKGERAAVGAERYEVEWEVLTTGAKQRYAADPQYEHDHDVDEVSVVRHFPAYVLAHAFATRLLKRRPPATVYGCCRITVQRVVPIEDCPHRVAEWEDVGEAEYLP